MRANPTRHTARNNSAIGDVILHRAQCLFYQRNYVLVTQMLDSWHPVSNSRLEIRTQRHIRTAFAKNLIFLEKYDDATTRLNDILGDADLEGPLKELGDFNWATVNLGQLHCKAKRYDEAKDLVNHRVRRFINEGRKLAMTASDYRIILCEALLKKERYSQVMEELHQLDHNLDHPEQTGNPRAFSQRLNVKTLRARAFYSQAQYPQALNAWKRILADLNIKEDAILIDGFKVGGYDKAVAIFSLAVTHAQLGDKPRAKEYVTIVQREPMSLEHPSSEIDYSEWMTKMKWDFDVLTAKPQHQFWTRFRKLFSKKRGIVPGAETMIRETGITSARDSIATGTERKASYEDNEVDFTTTNGTTGDANKDCPDCEVCTCELR